MDALGVQSALLNRLDRQPIVKYEQPRAQAQRNHNGGLRYAVTTSNHAAGAADFNTVSVACL